MQKIEIQEMTVKARYINERKISIIPYKLFKNRSKISQCLKQSLKERKKKTITIWKNRRSFLHFSKNHLNNLDTNVKKDVTGSSILKVFSFVPPLSSGFLLSNEDFTSNV